MSYVALVFERFSKRTDDVLYNWQDGIWGAVGAVAVFALPHPAMKGRTANNTNPNPAATVTGAGDVRIQSSLGAGE
jgi:hypothetical protein